MGINTSPDNVYNSFHPIGVLIDLINYIALSECRHWWYFFFMEEWYSSSFQTLNGGFRFSSISMTMFESMEFPLVFSLLNQGMQHTTTNEKDIPMNFEGGSEYPTIDACP